MYKVFTTQTYDSEIAKFSSSQQEEISQIHTELAQNPYSGRGLSYRFLREKRIKEKRIYYLVYDDLVLVLLIAAGGKKDQRATITYIKKHLGEFKEYAKKLSDSSDSF